jgi:hypothetical protein
MWDYLVWVHPDDCRSPSHRADAQRLIRLTPRPSAAKGDVGPDPVSLDPPAADSATKNLSCGKSQTRKGNEGVREVRFDSGQEDQGYRKMDREKPAQRQFAGVGATEAERQGHQPDGGEYLNAHQPHDLQ